MIVMMKAMSANNSKAEAPSGSDSEVDAELARLRAEVAELRAAGVPTEAPTSAGPADRS